VAESRISRRGSSLVDWVAQALGHLCSYRARFYPAFLQPGFSRDAVTPYEAATLLERLVALERHEYWSELPHLRRDHFRGITGHKQVTDFYLAKLAALHKAKVATFDSRIHTLMAPETLELISR
jgi:predicted nucleic acid-binding protein